MEKKNAKKKTWGTSDSKEEQAVRSQAPAEHAHCAIREGGRSQGRRKWGGQRGQRNRLLESCCTTLIRGGSQGRSLLSLTGIKAPQDRTHKQVHDLCTGPEKQKDERFPLFRPGSVSVRPPSGERFLCFGPSPSVPLLPRGRGFCLCSRIVAMAASASGSRIASDTAFSAEHGTRCQRRNVVLWTGWNLFARCACRMKQKQLATHFWPKTAVPYDTLKPISHNCNRGVALSRSHASSSFPFARSCFRILSPFPFRVLIQYASHVRIREHGGLRLVMMPIA